MKTKNPKKTAAKPAKNPPRPVADSVAPFSFPEWKADAQGIIPAPPIPPPPPVGAKVDPWRDWARRIVSRCGWSWEALEENERQPCSRAIVGWGGAVYWALAHAVKLTPARLDEAAAELAGVLVAAAEKKDCDRFCTACNLFPETVRRLAEAPADATPPASPSNPNADAKPSTEALDRLAVAVEELTHKNTKTSRKCSEAGRKGGRRGKGKNADVETALRRMRERVELGFSRRAAARYAIAQAKKKGESIARADGEPFKDPEGTLLRYYSKRYPASGKK